MFFDEIKQIKKPYSALITHFVFLIKNQLLVLTETFEF